MAELFCPTAACASTGRTVPLRATARPFARGALRPSEHNPIKRQAEPAAEESRASMDRSVVHSSKVSCSWQWKLTLAKRPRFKHFTLESRSGRRRQVAQNGSTRFPFCPLSSIVRHGKNKSELQTAS
jgi:hypothetical protein